MSDERETGQTTDRPREKSGNPPEEQSRTPGEDGSSAGSGEVRATDEGIPEAPSSSNWLGLIEPETPLSVPSSDSLTQDQPDGTSSELLVLGEPQGSARDTSSASSETLVLEEPREGEAGRPKRDSRRRFPVSAVVVPLLVATVAGGGWFIYARGREQFERAQAETTKVRRDAEAEVTKRQSSELAVKAANAAKAQSDQLLTRKAEEIKALESQRELADTRAEKATQEARSQARLLADARKDLRSAKEARDAERARREMLPSPEAKAAALDPARFEGVIADLKVPQRAAKGLRQLIQLAATFEDMDLLSKAASKLGDQSDALLEVCKEAAEKETEGRLKSLYWELRYELRSQRLSRDQPKAPRRADRVSGTGSNPIQRVSSPGRTAEGQTVRILTTQVDPQVTDSDLKESITDLDRATAANPDRPILYLKKGQACLRLGQRLQAAKNHPEATHCFEEASVAFRTGLDRLRGSPKGSAPLVLLSVGLSEGLASSLAAHQGAPSHEPVPSDLQGQLNHALARVAVVEKLLTAQEAERASDRKRLETLQSKLADEQKKLATNLEELGRLTDAEQNWTQFAKRAAAAVRFADPLPEYPGRWEKGRRTTMGWIANLVRELEAHEPLGRESPSPERDVADADAAYSSGLDSLFHGKYDDAIRKLSQGINRQPRDACFYYYRGIARHLAEQAGKPIAGGDAAEDMRRGVALERQDMPESRMVSLSLTRVQYGLRDWVESFRNPTRGLVYSSTPTILLPGPWPPSRLVGTPLCP